MEKNTFIDLFSGLGGIRIGFEQAAQDLKLENLYGECKLFLYQKYYF